MNIIFRLYYDNPKLTREYWGGYSGVFLFPTIYNEMDFSRVPTIIGSPSMSKPFMNADGLPDPAEENFELVGGRPLGQGAFAATWRARILDHGLIQDYRVSEVALKIPLDKEKERALKREVNLNAALDARLRRIKSPNIVRYLGVDVFRGRLVMVMEFVSGGSLRKLLAKAPSRTLPVDEAVRITEGILRGLSLIHDEQILHRDLKPDNVLMDQKNPKLADLGISRFLQNF